MNWIDVRTQLPDPDDIGWCIVAGDFDMTLASYDPEDIEWRDTNGELVEGVEFWMPVPDPPGAELGDN
jgi:hypothetical protein